MGNIIYKKSQGIEYIQFKKLLELGVTHCYTLKDENIDFTTGNSNEKESFNKICNALNIKREQIYVPIQTHKDNIKCIDLNMFKKNLSNTDALITDKKDIVLATRNADCILLFFYDPIKKVIANVHSGWRGTFQKIAEKTVIKMITNYGCKSEDILCFINPCIRKCHFEVDEDVKELCEGIFGFIGRNHEFIQMGDIKEGKQKYFIDTVLINKILLNDIGVKEKNIFDCEICSMCNSDKINSSRYEGKNFKRAIALIGLTF